MCTETAHGLLRDVLAEANMPHHAGASPSACFVVTSPAMANMLAREGPRSMGGAELQLGLVGLSLAKIGWEVSFLVGDYGQARPTRGLGGVRVLRAYPNCGRGLPITSVPWVLAEFWRALEEANADIYISRGLTWRGGVIAAYSALQRRHYVLWLAKNADARAGRPWLSPLPVGERLPAWYGMRAADAVIVQTDEQNALLRRYGGRSGFVVPNATPWEDGEPKNGPGEYVLWVGSMQPKKRPHMLLDAAQRLPHVRFVMAGGSMKAYPDLYPEVQARAGELPNVDFRGFVPFQETRPLFEKAAVVVSTSRGDEEGFPNVFLQAWSTATPVVATCDPDKVIQTHNLGYFCSDSETIVERIRELTSDPGLQQEVGTRALEYCLAHHSVDTVVDRLNDFLIGLLDGQNAGY